MRICRNTGIVSILCMCVVCLSAPASESCAHRLKSEWREGGKDVTAWDTATVLKDGRILTTAHSCGPEKRTITIEVDGKWIPAEVVKRGTECDLATIQTGTKIAGGIELADSVTFTVEASPKSRAVEKQEGGVLCGSIACKMEPGMSGGAVTKGGRLYGIIVSADPDKDAKDGMANVGRFVSADTIRDFLKK